MGFSLAVASRGCSPVAGCGLLTAVAPLVAEHGLWYPQTSVLQLPGSRALTQWLWCMGSAAVFPHQGGTHVPCFGRGAILYHWAARKALRGILDSSFPRSYLVREAWEPGVLSHSAGSAIKSSGASSERLPLPQSCLTLCDYADCSPPRSSVHGISQARLLEWVAISFSMCITFTSSQSIKIISGAILSQGPSVYWLLPLTFNIVPEGISNAKRQERKTKGIWI